MKKERSVLVYLLSVFIFSCGNRNNEPTSLNENNEVTISNRIDSLRKASFDSLEGGTINYIDFYAKALKIDSTDLTFKINHAYSISHFKNEKQSAIAEIKTILKKYPNNPDALFALGTVFYSINLDSGLYYCEKSLSINPKNFINWYNLSTYYDEQKMYSKAIMCINEAINLLPSKIDLKLVRGSYKLGLEDYKGAFEDMDTIPESYVKKSTVYFNRAKCLFYLKRFEEAISDCNKVIEEEKQSTISETFLIRGSSKLGLKQIDSAYVDIKKAYDMGNSDAVEIYNKLLDYYKKHQKI